MLKDRFSRHAIQVYELDIVQSLAISYKRLVCLSLKFHKRNGRDSWLTHSRCKNELNKNLLTSQNSMEIDEASKKSKDLNW